MTKQTLIVPKGIKFMNEWKEFKLLNHPHILDKGLTGCGFTHYCITNDENVILCSPRKMLLENKRNQHSEVFYAENIYDRSLQIDKDINPSDKNIPEEKDIEFDKSGEIQFHIDLKLRISNYILSCKNNNKPCKILVTYDSFRIVKEVLENYNQLNNFRIVIDEFQSIFTDSRFKSNTELEFVYHLQGIDKVCFVSATPMMDEYIIELEEFTSLPYYRLDWKSDDPMRTMKPFLEIHPSNKNVNIPANIIIKRYLIGQFEKAIIKNNRGELKEIESKEAVFYVNSVKNICDIIKSSKLNPGQVNILCADTPQNQSKIDKNLKKLGKFNIGTIPIKGEPHKMFTFCTRTVYLGADFYSTCARSFILSDANIECLAVDITLDLPQIMGRQRLDNNPWKNRATMYVKLLSESNVKSREDFDKYIESKIKVSYNLLDAHKTSATDEIKFDLAEKYLRDKSNYLGDYVAVNKHTKKGLQPVFNKLVMLAEKRAFDIQHVDFKDRFNVTSALSDIVTLSEFSTIEKFLTEFEVDKDFTRRMKLLCESNLNEPQLELIFKNLPLEYERFYKVLGKDEIVKYSYRKNNLETLYEKVAFKEEINSKDGDNNLNLQKLIYQIFNVGERITLFEIKEKLKLIYNQLGSISTPKATVIEEYFEVKKSKITINSKRVPAYELLNKRIK